MAINSKVIWSEGMFLSPQHFQQQDRYFERYIENRCSVFNPYGWGISEVNIDQQLLSLGKIKIESAKGVFPDGTPFNIPEIDEAPAILEVPENTHNSVVYLAIPVRKNGSREVFYSGDTASYGRYEASEHDIYDVVSKETESRSIQVGKLSCRLLLDSDDLSGYATIGIMRIVEKSKDQQVLIDRDFIPPHTISNSVDLLKSFMTELAGMLNHRGTSIAGRIADSRQAGTAEISDFLLLQIINKYEPVLTHLMTIKLHPERLYHFLLNLAGEVSTYTTKERRPSEFQPYIHDNLETGFQHIIQYIRHCFSTVYEQSAIALTFVERKYGIRVAEINDRSLIDASQFVIAVKADMQTRDLQSKFPMQTKIGPVEQIRQLVNAQLPGMTLQPLSVAPRQIPFHSGFVYYQIDRNSQFWTEMRSSGGFALHIAGEFPGLEIEFWAIREN